MSQSGARALFMLLLGGDAGDTGQCAPYAAQDPLAADIALADTLVRIEVMAADVHLCKPMTPWGGS